MLSFNIRDDRVLIITPTSALSGNLMQYTHLDNIFTDINTVSKIEYFF